MEEVIIQPLGSSLRASKNVFFDREYHTKYHYIPTLYVRTGYGVCESDGREPLGPKPCGLDTTV